MAGLMLKRAIQCLLSLTAIFQTCAGFFLLLSRRSDLVYGSAGLLLVLTGFLLLLCLLINASALMALVQVFVIVFQLTLVILIVVSFYFGMKDQLVVGIYFSSLCFFLLQSVLLRCLIRICYREVNGFYYDLQGATY